MSAQSCVIDPDVKDAAPAFEGRYGRFSPNLPTIIADEAARSPADRGQRIGRNGHAAGRRSGRSR
jgi:hypothetical protein